MKLDMECVRSVLLELEELPLGYYMPEDFSKSIKEYGENSVLYALAKLHEADYIHANIGRDMNAQYEFFGIYDITFSGHQFLEKIRDNRVWEKTKTIAGSVGSWAVDIIAQIATGIITELVSGRISV